jgi:hypothetical protein
MAKEWIGPEVGRMKETDLLRAATEALSSDFANPERTGCPEASTLEAIAERRLSFSDIDDLVDHIARCSPCFTAYNVYRKEYCFRYNRRRYTGGVAVLAVMIAASYFGRKTLSPALHPPVPISEVAPLTAVLDFHERTSERTVQVQTPGPTETPHLRRSLLNLQIRLPLGTEDGQYSLQFRNGAGGIIAQTAGTAKWDGATETLSARIDLRTIEPGQYTLAVRKSAGSWRQYSIFID